ncbi:cation diffusion facilitator family transporter [Gemelliphila palaticanis]|uniref:Cation transporter n=1 Tax=Gemelliphila palaticanis TaxID=81950 RepID=A0ABX2SYM6_9BACL|nr:cation diffusion facilitator family transporter [Gemella palaticanis]MBF0715506.1 cation transporter [Gemella palaticanis]NYS47436.1 cation transporter [Gemella palaticanis]
MNNSSIFANIKKAEKGAKISILTYLILSSFKLIIGFLFSSTSLIADGINNATDVVSSICVLIGLKISRKPADEDHKYGHLRAELISSLIASFIMLYAGLQVILFSTKKLIYSEFYEPSYLTALAALISFFIMIIVFMYNYKLSKKINSNSLKAAAFDNLSDALVSLGTLAGIMLSILGFKQADSLIAVLVGIIIVFTAVNIFKEATHILTDGIEKETLDEIFNIVKNIDGVRDIKELRGRSHGIVHFIDVTVTVDPNLNVIKSHDITVNIENEIQKIFFSCETLVHLEPDIKNKEL